MVRGEACKGQPSRPLERVSRFRIKTADRQPRVRAEVLPHYLWLPATACVRRPAVGASQFESLGHPNAGSARIRGSRIRLLCIARRLAH